LLALLEAMASNNSGAGEGTELREAADLLQQQLVYNGQVLDAALDALRIYKDGTQSLTFLHASVHLAYALMRMLEKWAKVSGDGSYVRKRAKPKKKRKAKSQCPYLRSWRVLHLGLTSESNSSWHGRTGWYSRC
jgi:replication fork protection complex subunit Tof1/Swi1